MSRSLRRASLALAATLIVAVSPIAGGAASAAGGNVVPITVAGSPTPIMGVNQALPPLNGPLSTGPGAVGGYNAGPDFASNIIDYRTSGQYQADQAAVSLAAKAFLTTWVKKNCKGVKNCSGKKAAAVFDIDDTLLDWYPSRSANNFNGPSPESPSQTCVTPAIAPVATFLQEAERAGVAVFLISGRPVAGQSLTQSCLNSVGITGWTGMTLRQPNSPPLASQYKSAARAAIQKQGYVIITSIGDQLSDMMGGSAVMGFKLPNPMYYIP